MKSIFLCFLGFFVSFSSLNAEIVKTTTTKTSQGTGLGITREEAVNNAIIEALSQIQGIQINSTKLIETNSIQDSNGNYLKDIYSLEISKTTNGKVDSYSIDDVSETSNGFEASVTIEKSTTQKHYKSPGISPDSRRKIAIFPVYTNTTNNFNILGKPHLRNNLSDQLTQELVNDITQTRKFTVLDREAKHAYDVEKSLIKSNDASKDELLKLGNILGTDYLYIVNISDFNIDKEAKKSNLTGKITVKTFANAIIEYRIIAMSTRQIKYSNTKNFYFEPKGQNDGQIFLNSIQTISKALTDDIINNIYPLKIVNISGNEIVLSQKLELGSKYEVFSLGKMIYDAYTKEPIGQHETKIGIIEIIKSNPKMSYAKIIEGNANIGNICRLIDDSNLNLNKNISESNKPSDISQTPNGGIILPFD